MATTTAATTTTTPAPSDPTGSASLADVQKAMEANQAYQAQLAIMQTNDSKKMAGYHAIADSAKNIR